jgi:hypothetical protein
MAAEHAHRGLENAGTGPHLTNLTKEEGVSNEEIVWQLSSALSVFEG